MSPVRVWPGVDPQNSEILYIVTDTKILKSLDAGTTWIDLTGDWDFIGFGPRNLAIDPVETNRIYASSYYGIYKSENGGVGWRSSFVRYVEDFVIDPVSPNKLFFATGENQKIIYFSLDWGETWDELKNASSPLDEVRFLEMDRNGEYLYAGTFFSGIKRLDVTNLKKVMYPPLNFTVAQVENRSLSLVEYINVLSWKMNSENKDITGYRLYITDPNGGKELLSVFYSPVFTYIHREIEKDYTYCLAAVDKEGRESPLAYASQTFR